MVEILLQYMYVLNHHVVHLKCIQCHVNYTQYRWEKSRVGQHLGEEKEL